MILSFPCRFLGFGEHDRKNDGDADGADIDQELHQRQERAVQEIVKAGQADTTDRQPANAANQARAKNGNCGASSQGGQAEQEHRVQDKIGCRKRVHLTSSFGVRPSPGAASSGSVAGVGWIVTALDSVVAAPGDGRTPIGSGAVDGFDEMSPAAPSACSRLNKSMMNSSLLVLAKLYSREKRIAPSRQASTQEPQRLHLVKSRRYLVTVLRLAPSGLTP